MKASIVTRAALALLGATLLVPAAMAEDAIPPDEEVPKSCPLSLQSSCSAKVIVWARNPSTDDCCMYLNPCSVPSGWESYNSILECQDA